MLLRPQFVFRKSLQPVALPALLLMLQTAVPAYGQAGPYPVPAATATQDKPDDAARETALERMVAVMNLYPSLKTALRGQFGAQNDPAFEQFINEAFPESWSTQMFAHSYTRVLQGASIAQIDDAARYFRSAEGKRIAALLGRKISERKSFDPSSKDWSPDEVKLLQDFARTPTGMMFSAGYSRSAHDASREAGLGEVMEHLMALLSAEQSRYTGMSADSFKDEIDSLHAGTSKAGVLAQLATVKEYNDRSAKLMLSMFDDAGEPMRRAALFKATALIDKDAIARDREDLQKVDDVLTRGTEGMRMMEQYSLECVDKMNVPETLGKAWRAGIGEKYKQANDKMAANAGTLREMIAAMRDLLDFAESHAAAITVVDGKLQFVTPEELENFRTLAARVDAARTKIRGMATAGKS